MIKSAELLKRVNRLSDINIELLDILTCTLSWIAEYCDRHNIPLHNEDALYRLLTYAQIALNDIDKIEKEIGKSRKLPPFNFDDENPEELPESETVILINS